MRDQNGLERKWEVGLVEDSREFYGSQIADELGVKLLLAVRRGPDVRIEAEKFGELKSEIHLLLSNLDKFMASHLPGRSLFYDAMLDNLLGAVEAAERHLKQESGGICIYS